MLQFVVIGNLGGDAEVKTVNGRSFVSFNVGHNEKFVDDQGVSHETTAWVSCAWNGDGGKLLPFLTKGRCVYVVGRGSVRTYSSPKYRSIVAGCNISVERIELVGAAPDDVPRQLLDDTGVIYNVNKCYFLDPAVIKEMKLKKGQKLPLHSRAGVAFNVVDGGFVVPAGDGAASSDSLA